MTYSPTPETVIETLRGVRASDRGDIVRLNMVKNLRVADGKVSLTIVEKGPGTGEDLAASAKRLLVETFGENVAVKIDVDAEMIDLGDMVQQPGQNRQQRVAQPGVVNILAVASGKGGVGKSTVSVNLALALKAQGFDVGLVDTDIYGPSIPTMLGMEGQKPRVDDERKIIPLEKFGIKTLSMGFLVDANQAVIWRGPMVSSAVRQFLGDARWGDLDFLILDLPPGTGDIQLTIVQTVPLTGAVVVSTPQEVALADARKGVAMFRNVQVPVLGIVENMAYFTPPDMPDRKYYLFGRGGAHRLAETLEVPFLGEVPIEQAIREGGDEGRPIVEADPEGRTARTFGRIAVEVARAVALRNAEQPPTQQIEILHR
jgi:ATP-binding protein involved in chromosome partitioning